MYGEVICHHGVKGQKWGVRRYQNEDGSLTDAGKKKYGVDEAGSEYNDTQYLRDKGFYGRNAANRINKNMIKGSSIDAERRRESDRLHKWKTAAGHNSVVGYVLGAAVGAIGGYHLYKLITSSALNNGTWTPATDVAATIIGSGAAAIGAVAGQKLGRNLVMNIGGYSKEAYRRRV